MNDFSWGTVTINMRNKLNWEDIGKQLLWNNVVSHKNEGSRYYMVDVDGYEERGLPKGSIAFALDIQSWIHPSCYHELTWKELYIAMDGPFADGLIPDGHDCNICPENKECHAYFKGNPDQEQCDGWKEEYNKLK